jgi:hypothetical protein
MEEKGKNALEMGKEKKAKDKASAEEESGRALIRSFPLQSSMHTR